MLVVRNFYGYIVVVAYRTESCHELIPVHIAFEKVAEAFDIAYAALEVLDVNLLDALAEYFYPVLCPAVYEYVAAVEVGLDVFAVELVDEVTHFKRSDEELVPYVSTHA